MTLVAVVVVITSGPRVLQCVLPCVSQCVLQCVAVRRCSPCCPFIGDITPHGRIDLGFVHSCVGTDTRVSPQGRTQGRRRPGRWGQGWRMPLNRAPLAHGQVHNARVCCLYASFIGLRLRVDLNPLKRKATSL